MKKKVIGIDIGASSGRVIKAELENEILTLEEIHRFSNGIERKDESYCWNIESLVKEIEVGLAKEELKGSLSLGIDTWGVDFILLDSEKKRIGEAVSYRDSRTEGMAEEFERLVMSKATLYEKTGIQFMDFNTLYQLYYMSKNKKEELRRAEHLLFIPDYLNFYLTGKIANEFTNASTSQMLNLKTGDWDKEIIEKLGISHIFKEKPILPGAIIGTLKSEIGDKLNLGNIKIIAPPTHDTASAVLSVPAKRDKKWAYISSGTWSLMGIEGEYRNSDLALKYNFTNEGGVEGTTRVLKNIMGLWLIQNVKKELEDRYSFSELVDLAKKEKNFKSLINPNDLRFFNPKSMIEEIKKYCEESNQERPTNPGQISKLIFHSLAISYKKTLEEIEELTGEKIEEINIIGGGCQNEYLNQLCSDYCGAKVLAGPIEGTVVGNVMSQYIGLGLVKDRNHAREIIKKSFQIKEYNPN